MIRKYKAEDFDSLIVLFEQLWDNKTIQESTINDIIHNDKSKNIYVYDLGKKVIGSIIYCIRSHLWAQGNVLEVEALIVDKENRNRGYGTEMIEYVEVEGKKIGCNYIELNSAFRRELAHKFYEKNGFNKCAYVFDKNIV